VKRLPLALGDEGVNRLGQGAELAAAGGGG